MYMYILAFSCSGYTLIYLPPPLHLLVSLPKLDAIKQYLIRIE